MNCVSHGRYIPPNAFVLDFLYHDSRRIASFLSQFDELGHLQRVTQTDESAAKEKEGSITGGSLGVPGTLGKHEKGKTASSWESETAQRVYDPFWANARRFLDLLTEGDMIQRDIENARIGQFVLSTGSLIILDNSMLRAIWDQPAVSKFIKAQEKAAAEAQAADQDALEPINRKQRRAEQSKARKTRPETPEVSETELALALMPHMPHSGQLHIVTDDFAVWAAAADEALVAPMSELILKHGQKVAGQWSMLGILDALPWEQAEMMNPLEMVRVGMTQESISNAALQMAPAIRRALGRPLLSYGMTPLLVFREVS